MQDSAEKFSPINGQKTPKGKRFAGEYARECARKRNAKRKAEASITEEFRRLVNQYQTDKNGNQMLGAEVLAKSIMQGCINGNAKAMDLALAIMGEKPADKIQVIQTDWSALDEENWQ